MHEKVLQKHSMELVKDLQAAGAPCLAGWTLAGGTGLALRLGHRVSDDLDFFRTDSIDVRALHETLAGFGPYETLQEAEHTLTVLLRKTKLSFFRVRDPFLFEGTSFRFFTLADTRDIALMKLAAISGRGSRKDFIDLYTILREKPSLMAYLDLLPKKYGKSRINIYHVVKSLTYFEDAETEPMPKMLEPFRWSECKAFFIREGHRIVMR